VVRWHIAELLYPRAAWGCLKRNSKTPPGNRSAPTCGYPERIPCFEWQAAPRRGPGLQEGTETGQHMELKDTNVETIIETFNQSDCTLAPGDLIEQSGIYEICHQDEPRASVILMRNTIFPFCRRCGDMVRYKILELVPHISEDPDFQEEPPETDNPSLKMQIQTSTFPMQLGRAHGFRFQQDCLQTWSSSPQGGDI
jgi:ribosomal protein L37E